MFLFPFASCFLETTLPLLLMQRSFLVRPPFVYTAVPFQTLRFDPVCIFFVTRLGLRARMALRTLLALGARGFEAFAAFGALGFRALRAALLVARLAAALLAERGFVASRATVFAAIVIDLVSEEALKF